MTTPVPTPKKRNTKSWKTLALNLEKEAAGLNSLLGQVRTQLDDAHAVTKMWKDTHAFTYKAMVGALLVALGELITIVWLVFR